MKIPYLSSVLLLALAISTPAEASKYQIPLVNPDSAVGNSVWNNDEVDASFQLNKCRTKISIKANESTGLPGKNIVCILSGNTYTSFGVTNSGNSTVYRGTVDATKGKMVAKADDRAIGCGLTTAASTTSPQIKCYEDSGWSASLRCLNLGGAGVPTNILPNTSRYNAGALVGTCSGATIGFEMTPPSGSDTVLAQGGYPTVCKKCP